MQSTTWTAVASVAIFAAGQLFNSLKDKTTRRSAVASEARAAVREVIQASLDVKAALEIWETRRRDKRSIAGAWAHSMAQVMAGYAEDRPFHGAAQGLGSAMAWRRAADAADEAVITGPMSRVTAAASRIAMLNDAALRKASAATTEALGKLMATYAGSPKSTARAKADKELDEAISQLAEAARAYSGRPAR